MTIARVLVSGLIVFTAGCASAPPPAPVAPTVTWEQKLSWIVRLEDTRTLRDPQPPPPPAAPARGRRPVVVPPAPQVPDLTVLLGDPEGRVRRRAALAIGRVGLPEGVPPLVARLADPDAEVREMVAFGLGLLGDASATDPLVKALQDPDARVQGRAAEALGLVNATSAAPRIGELVAAKMTTGAIASIAVDDLGWPLAPDVEAFRLGLYALVRLKAWDAMARAVLDERGLPRASWWPVAYALQRIEDPRAAPALHALLRGRGIDAVAFAARGLGNLKETTAVPRLLELVAPAARQDPRIVAQAIRALGQIGDTRAAPDLVALATANDTDPNVRLEAVTALGAMRATSAYDRLLNLVAARSPVLRGAVLRALAAIDADAFMAVLSTLDTDPDWLVRSELAGVLGTLGPERATDKLQSMLKDADARVLPAVLEALAAIDARGVDDLLLAELGADDVNVRTTAARLIGTRKSTAAAAALAGAIERSRADTAYDARMAAIEALVALDPARGREALTAALGDKDWAVRRRAADLLAKAGAPADPATYRPVPGGHDRAFYESTAVVAPPYSPQAYVDTSKGAIQIELNVVESPLTTENFVRLARAGYFNDKVIHRVVPNFVVQDGDPRGDGTGGPGYTIRDELSQLPYLRGTVGMALDWQDTGGSQFFITHGPQPHLDARYAIFGRVVSGMEVVDRLVKGDVIQRIRIWDGVEFR